MSLKSEAGMHDVTRREDAATADDRKPRGPGTLSILGLAWLAITLWSVQATITSAQEPALALVQAALALPDLAAASLVAGATAGLVVVERRSASLYRPWMRYAAGAVGGLVVGALIAVLIIIGYGTTSAIVLVAATIGSAAVIGGALAGVRPGAVVAAGLAGTLAWFAVGFVQGLFRSQLLHVFGGRGAADEWTAAVRMTFAVSLVGGAIGGVVAYRYLRRRYTGRRWHAYLVAGAAPGVLFLLSDAVTRIGGAQLLNMAASMSTGDGFAVRLLGASRLNHGLLVLFAGALAAVLAYGRTLKGPADRAQTGRTTPARGPRRRRP
jgi:hypothetical protein